MKKMKTEAEVLDAALRLLLDEHLLVGDSIGVRFRVWEILTAQAKTLAVVRGEALEDAAKRAREELYDEVKDEVEEAIKEELYDEVKYEVEEEIREELYEEIKEEVEETIKKKMEKLVRQADE